jgi:uncharacterized membrane protein (UPF0127 family)
MPAKDGDIYMLRVGPSGGPVIQVETVTSPAAIKQGLSGRPSMPSGTGLFFIFPELAIRSMWMPNMRFPLDIVWLDEHLSVVSITYAAKPCPTLDNCPQYSSNYKALYAIEMNAGDAAAKGFRVGLSLAVVS